jgi:hypothetical protein
MASMGQVQAHESFMWPHQSLVHLQVGRASAQALNVDTPLFWTNVESLQCSLLACELDGIDVLVSTIVSGSRVPL